MTDKYIQALARHERAQQEVKRLKGAIGESIALCPVELKCHSLETSFAERDRLIDVAGGKYHTKTHLWHALRAEKDDEGERSFLRSGEIDGYLADAETGCPHCLEAWRLIQQRKKARQELGAAKRVLRALGRSAVKLVEASTCL